VTLLSNHKRSPNPARRSRRTSRFWAGSLASRSCSSAHRHRSLRPAPILAPRDELADSPSRADREARAVAFSREIRDGRGRVWTLREKRLSREWTAAHLAARTLARAARGWLLFENGLRQIVVTPPPHRWQEWDDRALIRLMERHAPRRTR